MRRIVKVSSPSEVNFHTQTDLGTAAHYSQESLPTAARPASLMKRNESCDSIKRRGIERYFGSGVAVLKKEVSKATLLQIEGEGKKEEQ